MSSEDFYYYTLKLCQAYEINTRELSNDLEESVVIHACKELLYELANSNRVDIKLKIQLEALTSLITELSPETKIDCLILHQIGKITLKLCRMSVLPKYINTILLKKLKFSKLNLKEKYDEVVLDDDLRLDKVLLKEIKNKVDLSKTFTNYELTGNILPYFILKISEIFKEEKKRNLEKEFKINQLIQEELRKYCQSTNLNLLIRMEENFN
jgi:hypothetical protein